MIKVKKILKIILCLFICIILFFIYIFKIEPFLLVVHQYKIKGNDSSIQSNIKLIQISDIQVSKSYTEKNLEKIVKKINALSPDIVVFTGDLFDNYAKYHPTQEVKKALLEIKAKYGKYAIWGNRDYGGGAFREYKNIMEYSEFTLLENESKIISLPDNKKLLIGGADDILLGNPDKEKMIEEMNKTADYKIFLVHEPDFADDLEKATIDLILAGHSHGGQVRLPFFKEKKTALAKKYTKGFYDLQKMKLYVNTGIGTSHIPARFMVIPEIALFTITI